MIKTLLVFLCCVYGFGVQAALHENQQPPGFLWYNLKEKTKKAPKIEKRGVPFNRLSFTDRDAVLRFYTMEALHKARVTKSVEDMRAFLALQDYWLKESSHFSNLFQQTMLLYPQYDYTVTHPVSNIGVKVTDGLREESHQAEIKKLSQTHGLLFFYRGSNPYDQKQIPIVRDFCKRFNFSLIPISVDGQFSESLLHSRFDHGQANALGVRYFPAILLVNPNTKKTLPVAFGLTTQDALALRLYKVATNFKGETV